MPHPVLLKVINLAGLKGATYSIIRDIYLGSTTSIQTKSDRSSQIPCLRGVKQGCPLSPILFDLIMEVVIRAMEQTPESGYQVANSTTKTHTYVDDLCAIAPSPDIMQKILSNAQTAAKWAGLRFNPKKCAVLNILRGSRIRQRVTPSQLTLEGDKIPVLDSFQAARTEERKYHHLKALLATLCLQHTCHVVFVFFVCIVPTPAINKAESVAPVNRATSSEVLTLNCKCN